MWVPREVADWFKISKDSVDALREELSAIRAERDSLQTQLSISQNHFDWLRIRVNTLEIERAQLIKKAYGIDIPVPEIVRTNPNPLELNADLFTDMGEDAAKKLGLPVYSN